jgi:hypothetical protein
MGQVDARPGRLIGGLANIEVRLTNVEENLAALDWPAHQRTEGQDLYRLHSFRRSVPLTPSPDRRQRGKPGRLLDRRRHCEDGLLVERLANDLQPERQPVRVQPRRN